MCTTSDASPDVRSNSAVSSKPGVWTRDQPYCAHCSSIVRITRHHRWSRGRTSCVPRGAWNLLAHCRRAARELCEERVARELDAERRLVAVAGMDDRLGREPLDEHADRGEQRVPVGAGQVDATDRAGEEEVAAEELAVGVEGDVRRRVAGHGEALERDARDLDRLAAAHEVLGRVRPSGHADRRELRVALEPLALAFGHPDLGAGSLGEVGDAADVVEVAVRDEDPGARGAEPRELEAKVGGVPARDR